MIRKKRQIISIVFHLLACRWYADPPSSVSSWFLTIADSRTVLTGDHSRMLRQALRLVAVSVPQSKPCSSQLHLPNFKIMTQRPSLRNVCNPKRQTSALLTGWKPQIHLLCSRVSTPFPARIHINRPMFSWHVRFPLLFKSCLGRISPYWNLALLATQPLPSSGFHS